jgi:predicted metal-binding membrane protein
MVYDPVEISLFSITWTVGMAAMMFPATTPMILFYNREIRSRRAHAHCSLLGPGVDYEARTLSLPILYGSLNIL